MHNHITCTLGDSPSQHIAVHVPVSLGAVASFGFQSVKDLAERHLRTQKSSATTVCMGAAAAHLLAMS